MKTRISRRSTEASAKHHIFLYILLVYRLHSSHWEASGDIEDTNSSGGVWIENVGIQFSLESSEESYAIFVYHISLFLYLKLLGAPFLPLLAPSKWRCAWRFGDLAAAQPPRQTLIPQQISVTSPFAGDIQNNTYIPYANGFQLLQIE